MASYPDKSEEIMSEENHGKFDEFTKEELKMKVSTQQAEGLGVEPPRKCSDCPGCRKCSSRGQQYKERDIKSAEKKRSRKEEKSVTVKEVSKSSTSKEDSKEVSDLKAATKSLPRKSNKEILEKSVTVKGVS